MNILLGAMTMMLMIGGCAGTAGGGGGRSPASAGVAEVNGTKLHYEVRGRGPALLMIPGATGDADHFARVAPLLAERYTVVTYDRRGNSRSPATGPTTLDQQADDAAALLRHLELAPATVFGTSGGAIIALRLALRHAEACARVLVHEPPFMAVLPNAEEEGKKFQAMVGEALAKGGPRGAMELFIRVNAGDATFEALEPPLRDRMLANGERFFGAELSMFLSWVPSEAELRALRVRVDVLAGADNGGSEYAATSAWLARQLGTEVGALPGKHVPYFTHPTEMASALTAAITTGRS